MFHPNGPNFLLSCTKAWKNVNENTNRFHSLGLVQVSKLIDAGTTSWRKKKVGKAKEEVFSFANGENSLKEG